MIADIYRNNYDDGDPAEEFTMCINSDASSQADMHLFFDHAESNELLPDCFDLYYEGNLIGEVCEGILSDYAKYVLLSMAAGEWEW